ncbi:DUF4973 domain-containing protein [Flavobacterium sp. MAHUQ-51]|uniref:DUF4973 domain-containing protein n=1 Tax=Flavobacterium sp. GCM10022190 TaxID=3252639 RepID=UPI00361DEB1E
MLILICGACNDEWTDEQFQQLVSFKAPITSGGVSDIYIRYKGNDETSFKLPLIISGSRVNDKDRTVHVAVDPDTLDVLNYERFQNRQDFYYRNLDSKYFTFPSEVAIKKGENTSLLDVKFTLKDIDMVDKWVLPLTILNDASYDYVANPRKHYRKALLRINPFNDYSGTYSGTALRTVMKGYENQTPIVKSEIKSYVVNENKIFFYAGSIDEERIDRRNYKIYATFNSNGGVTLSSDNPNIEFKINKDASYTLIEKMDEVRPYLMHKYLTINNIDYEYTDYTMVPSKSIKYRVSGSLILERRLNTQIPDEDQAIEW